MALVFDNHNEGRLEGALTIYEVSALWKSCQDAIFSGAKNFQIDLSMVTDFDTAGLQFLLALKQVFHNSGRKLTLVSHSIPVIRVIELSGTAARLGDPIVLGKGLRKQFSFSYGVKRSGP